MNELETLHVAIRVVSRPPTTIPERGVQAAIHDLLTEAFDYTREWQRGRVRDRGPKPSIVYRKEFILAEAIARGAA